MAKSRARHPLRVQIVECGTQTIFSLWVIPGTRGVLSVLVGRKKSEAPKHFAENATERKNQ